MKTKLQLSKNVTMNKPDEKRQGMKVRTVVTGHNAKGRAVFVRDEKVDGTPAGSGNSDRVLSGNSGRSRQALRSRSTRAKRQPSASPGRGRSDRSHDPA